MTRSRSLILSVLLLGLLTAVPVAQAQQAFIGSRVGYGGFGITFGAVGGAYFSEILGLRSSLDASFPFGIFIGRFGVELLARIPTNTMVEPYFAIGPAIILAAGSGGAGVGFGGGAALGVEVIPSPQIGIAAEGGVDVWFGTSVVILGKGSLGVNFRF